MDKKRLDERLEQLHAELQRVESVDDNELKILRELSADIRELLEKGGEHQPEYKQLGDRLRAGIELLEASHPSITMAMGQVADALAKMGI